MFMSFVWHLYAYHLLTEPTKEEDWMKIGKYGNAFKLSNFTTFSRQHVEQKENKFILLFSLELRYERISNPQRKTIFLLQQKDFHFLCFTFAHDRLHTMQCWVIFCLMVNLMVHTKHSRIMIIQSCSKNTHCKHNPERKVKSHGGSNLWLMKASKIWKNFANIRWIWK